MRKRFVLMSVLMVFGMSMLAGCNGNEITIDSRSDDTVTERDSAITYDIDGEENSEEDLGSTETVDTDAGSKEEAEEVKEDKKPEGFVFSTDPEEENVDSDGKGE